MDGHWEDGKRHGGFIFTFPNGERCLILSLFNLTANFQTRKGGNFVFIVTRNINDTGMWLDYESD